MKYNFNFPHDLLMEYAGTMVRHLTNDLPDFTAFDRDLSEAKKNRMEAIIRWFLTEGGDRRMVSDLSDLTAKVTEELDHCRRVYHQLRYWVMKTYPSGMAIQRKFGIGRFGKIAENRSKMVLFMSTLVKHVADHTGALEAAGTPAAILDEIANRSEALRLACETQEVKKGARSVTTAQRVAQLNELYQHTRDFNTAAAFVFVNNSAKRDLYRPPSQPQKQASM